MHGLHKNLSSWGMFGYLEYPVDEVDHIAFWDFTNNDYGYCGECVEN